MSSLYWNSLHSYQIHRTPLGQIRSNCVMLSCQLRPKSVRNVSYTFLNLWHKESRQFWPFSNTCNYKLWLIKWRLSKHCRRMTSWMKLLHLLLSLKFLLFCIYFLYFVAVIVFPGTACLCAIVMINTLHAVGTFSQQKGQISEGTFFWPSLVSLLSCDTVL